MYTTLCEVSRLYLHSCGKCGRVLFSMPRFGGAYRRGISIDAIMDKARAAMKEHLGYASADHFEAMGL